MLRKSFVFLVFGFFFCQWHICESAFAGEKLAVVSQFTGSVSVKHEGQSLTVEQRGNRIKNSSMYDKDSIITKAASTAQLVFTDSSSLDIQEKTNFRVRSKKTSRMNKSELRSISLNDGGFTFNITPSKTVLTEFETPAGVASVRGTAGDLNVIGATGETTIDLSDGEIGFNSPQGEATFSMTAGDKVRVKAPSPGKVGIVVDAGEIVIHTKAGTIRMSANDGITLEIDPNTGTITIIVTSGTVEFTPEGSITPQALKAGSKLVIASGGTVIETQIPSTETVSDNPASSSD